MGWVDGWVGGWVERYLSPSAPPQGTPPRPPGPTPEDPVLSPGSPRHHWEVVRHVCGQHRAYHHLAHLRGWGRQGEGGDLSGGRWQRCRPTCRQADRQACTRAGHPFQHTSNKSARGAPWLTSRHSAGPRRAKMSRCGRASTRLYRHATCRFSSTAQCGAVRGFKCGGGVPERAAGGRPWMPVISPALWQQAPPP